MAERAERGEGVGPSVEPGEGRGYERVLLLVDRGADRTQADGK
eukprot:COSAG02_NODE_68322_length_251_cov_0.486842_1_plen_42_part_01